MRQEPLKGDDIWLAEMFSLGLIGLHIITGKVWDFVHTGPQLFQAHTEIKQRFDANKQSVNDEECRNLIARLLRIESPFTNFEELLKHPYFTSTAIVLVNTGEKKRISKSDELMKIRNECSIPIQHQILLSPTGKEVLLPQNLDSTIYLFSLRKEDYVNALANQLSSFGSQSSFSHFLKHQLIGEK